MGEESTPSAPPQGNETTGEVETGDEILSGAAITDASKLPGAIFFIHLTDAKNIKTMYSAVAYDSDILPGMTGSQIIQRWQSAVPYYEVITEKIDGKDNRAKFSTGQGDQYGKFLQHTIMLVGIGESNTNAFSRRVW